MRISAFVFSFIIYYSAFLAATASAAANDANTARNVFAMIPLTIFETTSEGLTEADRQELLLKGKSEYWEIAGETPDVMVFATLPFRDRSMALRIFPNELDGSSEVAIGSLDAPICSLELWRLDAGGSLVPVDTPPEPDITDFFVKTHKLSKTISHSILMCIGAGGLRAVPIFWNKMGMLPSSVDNEISYQWTGSNFARKITPRPKH